MNVRLLLFSGTWEGEGNILALETEKNIILLSTGENAPFLKNKEIVNLDYLAKNRTKIKAVLINNSIPKNFSSLPKIYQELSLNVPIYGSAYSKIILEYLFPSTSDLQKNLITVENEKMIRIGDFYCLFLPLTGYSLDNLAIMINYKEQTFYYMNDFAFHNLKENDLLSETKFFSKIKELITHQKKTTYLITSCQNIRWNNNNSLLLAVRNLPYREQNYFFFLYEFDWLHILELLELANVWQKKIKILEPAFLNLLKRLLKNSKLAKVIAEPEEKVNIIYLLVFSPTNIESKLLILEEDKDFSIKENLTFVVGLSPTYGGEGKIARVIDYLYQKKGQIINLSRSDTFALGTSFRDLKLILDILQPNFVITLQNSFEQKKYLNYLKNNFISFPNNSYLDLVDNKIYPLPLKEKWETEKLLAIQRQNLLQNGFLLVFILVNSSDKNEVKQLPKIIKLKLEEIAITSVISLKKVEEKIRQWWEKKDFSEFSSQIWKKKVERHLASYLKKYLIFEYDVEADPLILLFFNKN